MKQLCKYVRNGFMSKWLINSEVIIVLTVCLFLEHLPFSLAWQKCSSLHSHNELAFSEWYLNQVVASD